MNGLYLFNRGLLVLHGGQSCHRNSGATSLQAGFGFHLCENCAEFFYQLDGFFEVFFITELGAQFFERSDGHSLIRRFQSAITMRLKTRLSSGLLYLHGC